MKILFNKYEAFTDEANSLSNEIEFAVHPIVVKYQKQGFSLRDILSVVISTVSMMINELILRNSVDMMKKERLEKR